MWPVVTDVIYGGNENAQYVDVNVIININHDKRQSRFLRNVRTLPDYIVSQHTR